MDWQPHDAVFGMPPRQLANLTLLLAHVHPDDREVLKTLLRTAGETRNTPQYCSLRLLLPDAHYHHVECRLLHHPQQRGGRRIGTGESGFTILIALPARGVICAKTVVIADDHPVFLIGLRTVVTMAFGDNFTIVGEAQTVDQLLALLAENCRMCCSLILICRVNSSPTDCG